jgi:hypothetical protein
MPAFCTLRLNCFSAISNESPGLTFISVMRATSAPDGHPVDSNAVIGNNPDSRQVDPHVVGMEPEPRFRNQRTSRYTSGGVRGLGSHCHRHSRYDGRHQLVCELRGNLDNVLERLSSLCWHKTLAHPL